MPCTISLLDRYTYSGLLDDDQGQSGLNKGMNQQRINDSWHHVQYTTSGDDKSYNH